MAQRTCTMPNCERPHLARGLCRTHWNAAYRKRKYVEVACPTCGEATTKRDDGPSSTRKFCSLVCRDLWRIDQPDDPMYTSRGRAPSTCPLPADHPVRQLIQANARKSTSRRGPLRSAIEAQEWKTVLRLIEQDVVKVDDCWLWARQRSKSYGKVVVGERTFFVHRLVMTAKLDGELDPTMPVHHKCAETLCCNPGHLQLVTHRENVAEMMERRYYVDRIAVLETALRGVAPSHPVLTPWLVPERLGA